MVMMKHRKKVSFRVKGFTLIEIMVALAVLALSGVALMTTMGQASTDLGRLSEKMIALNVAEYAINSVRIKKEFPDIGSDEDIVQLNDREWRVELTVSETGNENVRRIDVLVYPYGGEYGADKSATVLLSAFMSDIYQ
jgi:general secretion pathway protein I